MVAEKRIYSTTALQNCYRALRSARWSVRRKDEHMTRCCEVRELYVSPIYRGCYYSFLLFVLQEPLAISEIASLTAPKTSADFRKSSANPLMWL